MDNSLIESARMDMEAVVGIIADDLAMVKSGRAKPSLVEKILVDAYGTRLPLIELASISAPEPTLLVIQPWDESISENILRALSTSELNLNPAQDGSVIRIQIPALTEERRQEYVKLVKQKIEGGRVLIRQVRQEIKKKIENMKGQPGISEDDIHRLVDELEKVTDEFIGRIADMGNKKEAELLTI